MELKKRRSNMKYFDYMETCYVESLATDILYADMNIKGNVDFLTMAYDKLGIDAVRVMKMRKKWPKISSRAVHAIYEDIIGIIIEELCQKGNSDLCMDLIDFYSQRFPFVKEQLGDCRQGAKELLCTAERIQKSDSDDLILQSFTLLYCYAYGDSGVRRTLLMDRLYVHRRYIDHFRGARNCFLEDEDILPGCNHWGGEPITISEFKNTELFREFVETQKDVVSEFCGVITSRFEPFFVEYLTMLDMLNFSYVNLDGLATLENWNAVCRKHGRNQLIIFEAKDAVYLDMLRDIFEGMCMKEVILRCPGDSDEDDETTGIEILEEICKQKINNPEAFLKELMLTFWFECYLMSQEEMYDKYYEWMSYDLAGIDIKETIKENDRLKEELSQCRKKLQQYADADSERKKQQDHEAKKDGRKNNEKIASLEKQLEEKNRALEKQAETMENLKAYAALVEDASNLMSGTESVDISKIYQHKVLFVGGRQETVTRLKAVFSTAGFVADETVQTRQKADLIVLMPGLKHQSTYYEYIGFAREKGIKVTYCNGTDVEAITRQVACNL
ncbi:MAG: hypothetical protein NC307_12220 [Roseburia sp.]|nr:hypothetical protein [Roseburia sp.]